MIWKPAARPDPKLTLVCLPHAGAGPTAFAGWPKELNADVEVAAIRLPGRESRLREHPFRCWPALLDALVPALTEALTSPFVLFGHSLGAMIAYELASRLTAAGPPPRGLILAGCRAPHIPSFLPAIHDRPEPEFLAGLKLIGPIPDAVLADQRFLRLLVPMLRADLELAEAWPPSPPVTVTVPLAVMAGVEDPVAPPGAVQSWSQYSRAGFSSHLLHGDHFFVGSTGFFGALRSELAAAAG